MKNKRKT